MLKIRLQRVGRKHDPSYRIILTDVKQGPKSGKFIENLGFYDARRDVREVKGERVNYWIGKGAQVSDTVHNILVTEKVIEGKKINVLPKKTPIKKEEVEVKEEKVAPVVEMAAAAEELQAETEAKVEEVVEDSKEEIVVETEVEEKKE